MRNACLSSQKTGSRETTIDPCQMRRRAVASEGPRRRERIARWWRWRHAGGYHERCAVLRRAPRRTSRACVGANADLHVRACGRQRSRPSESDWRQGERIASAPRAGVSRKRPLIDCCRVRAQEGGSDYSGVGPRVGLAAEDKFEVLASQAAAPRLWQRVAPSLSNATKCRRHRRRTRLRLVPGLVRSRVARLRVRSQE